MSKFSSEGLPICPAYNNTPSLKPLVGLKDSTTEMETETTLGRLAYEDFQVGLAVEKRPVDKTQSNQNS